MKYGDIVHFNRKMELFDPIFMYLRDATGQELDGISWEANEIAVLVVLSETKNADGHGYPTGHITIRLKNSLEVVTR